MKFSRRVAIGLIISILISFSVQIIYATDMQNIRYHVSESQNISSINQPNDITDINQSQEDISDTNQPKEDIPDINQPIEDIPDINQPKEDIPDINQPIEDIPDINQPIEDIPDINQPIEDIPDINQPIEDIPDTNQPIEDIPDTNQPIEDIPDINDSSNFEENKFNKLKTEIETGTKDNIEIEDDIIFEDSINILKPITIEGKLKNDGSKPKLIIEYNKTSNSSFRHFNASKNLKLKNLDLIVNGQIENDVELGGIYAEADISIENCHFINNHNKKGGAIYSQANIELDGDCLFFENKASQLGGAIYSENNISINKSAKVTFTENEAIFSGGAIYSEGNVSVNKSSEANFKNNEGEHGGAIYSIKSIELDGDCLFLENIATQSGGAIYIANVDNPGYLYIKGKSTFHKNESRRDGGAIHSEVNININNSAEVNFTENEATSFGGAIYISPSFLTKNSDSKNISPKMNIENDSIVKFIENKVSEAGGAIYAYLNVDLNFNSNNMVKFENNGRLNSSIIDGSDLFLFCNSKSYMKNTIFESKDKNNDSRIFICNNFYYFDTIQSLKIEKSEVDCSGSFIETSAIFSGSNQNYIITFNKVIFENLSSIISTIKMPEPVILDNNIAEDKRFTLSLKVNDSSFITDDLDIIFFFKEDDGFENYLYSIIDIDLTNNTFIIDNKFSINSLSTIFEHNTLRAKEISTCLFGNFANNIIISDTRSDELVEHLGEQSDSIENFNSHYIGETVKLLDKETRGSLFWRILDLFQDSGIIAPVNNEKQYLAEKYLALIFKKNEINAIKIIIESNGANIDKDKLEEFSKQSKASLFEDIKSSFDQVEEGQLKESLKSINENIQVLKVDNFYLIDQLDIEKVLEDKAFEFDLIVNKNIKHYEPTEDSLANGFEVFSDITEDAIGRSRFPKSTLGSIQGEDIGKVKIFFTAGSNGSLSGKTSFRLNKGSKWTMIDVPKPIANNGYRFSSWSPNLKDDSYIINDDLEFKAKFERKPSSGGSGGGSGGSDKEPDKEPDKEIEKPKDRNGRELGTIIEEKVDIQLNKKDHFAYVKGYGDGSVRPTRDITREEVAIIIYRLIVEKDKEYITTSEHSFSDIESNRWSEKAIASLARVGIIKGYEDGTFKPTKSISRSEAAKIIGRFTDTIVCETNFPDILDHWAEDYINSVEAKGWIKGYNDGTFKPNNNITRGEYVTLMNNLLERKVKIENTLPGIKEFNDLNTNKWYYEQMIEALNGHEYEKLEDNTGKWIKLIDKYFE